MLSVCHLHLVFSGYRVKFFHQLNVFGVLLSHFFKPPLSSAYLFLCPSGPYFYHFATFMVVCLLLFSLFFIVVIWVWKQSTLSMLNICPWRTDSPPLEFVKEHLMMQGTCQLIIAYGSAAYRGPAPFDRSFHDLTGEDLGSFPNENC